jgi:hypothetical protein
VKRSGPAKILAFSGGEKFCTGRADELFARLICNYVAKPWKKWDVASREENPSLLSFLWLGFL